MRCGERRSGTLAGPTPATQRVGARSALLRLGMLIGKVPGRERAGAARIPQEPRVEQVAAGVVTQLQLGCQPAG